MIIEYPEKLLTQVKRATKDNRLTGFVPGMGSRHPRLVLIGEAPGREEIKQGRPFVGSSGKELTKMVELAGLTRDELYITSVVRSRPYSIKHVKNARGEVVEKHPNRTPVARWWKSILTARRRSGKSKRLATCLTGRSVSWMRRSWCR